MTMVGSVGLIWAMTALSFVGMCILSTPTKRMIAAWCSGSLTTMAVFQTLLVAAHG